jgi:RNA polymerase sigma-70 factor (ECF subfamily)
VTEVSERGGSTATQPQHEKFRGELLAHCYRILGSYDEAEDAVQETLLRAWRAADRYDPRRSSVRTWLYRIATNTCLTALARRQHRPLPSGLGAAGTDPMAPLVPNFDVPWLQPFPDASMGTPEDLALQRAGLRLAFVAALQFLPPRQRAVLVLREVLQLSAAEVAEILESTVAAVNSCLQRARSTVRSAGPTLEQLREPTDPAQREVIEKYLLAFEAADVARLTRLLADDVALEMPPVNLWLSGRENYRQFMDRVFSMRGKDWRMVPVQANGTTALAAFAPDTESPSGVRPHSLQIFEVRGGRIERCVAFIAPATASRFALIPDGTRPITK